VRVTCSYVLRDQLSVGIVRLLREELQLLHEPGSYVGEVVKVMGKNKVLVKVQPEGKYSTSRRPRLMFSLTHLSSRRH
jgi:ATP-dependent 26S proteasome regulatory subunit